MPGGVPLVEPPSLASVDAFPDLEDLDAAMAAGRGGYRRFGNPSVHRLEEALVALDKALALAPDSPSALFDKAQTLEALGRGPEAGQCYARFVSVAPAHQAEKQFLARQKALEFGADPA